ncbi:MAG: DUF2508 family protein [Clostridia bacterium]|nr:DUF2508 family protein [Clostridia bacterium]
MGCKYERETIIVDKSEEEKSKELMDTILQTKKVINDANKNYEMAEGKLIDYFLYTMKAEQARLDYLITRAKKMGMTVEPGEQLNVKNI